MTNAVVKAGPTKKFFVQMLTRDIELQDAVLDLLDNCIDGVLRVTEGSPEPDPDKPYEGFSASITATPDGFMIEDNCGGIPVDVAVESAFMFGRPDERDTNLKTVGMYGIGMKRAIFKMGRESVVTSQPTGSPYQVKISEEWLEDDGDWNLELVPSDSPLSDDGTTIEVANLYPAIARQFDPAKSKFLSELRQEIARLYALIIEKGFQVRLNGDTIKPVEIGLLAPEEWGDDPSIRPYVFEGELEDVTVNLVVGFYRPLATEDEQDKESESPRSSSHRAGWTVICNDRVVLYGDRSLVTGWGRGTVPRFHNQFMAIAGVIVFESVDSLALPLNTTKRGLDTSSSVYLSMLDYMQEGTKVFTSFTNQWKARESEVAHAFDQTERVPFDEISKTVDSKSWTTVRKVAETGGRARKFTPDLPKPPDRSRGRRISFSRPIDDIRVVSDHLFGDPEVTPKEVGAKAFDVALDSARGADG